MCARRSGEDGLPDPGRQPGRGFPEPAVDDDGRLVAQVQALRPPRGRRGRPVRTSGRPCAVDTDHHARRREPPRRPGGRPRDRACVRASSGRPRRPPRQAPRPRVPGVRRVPRGRPARSPRRRSRGRGRSRARPSPGRSRCRRSRPGPPGRRRRACRPSAPRACRSRRSRGRPREAARAGRPRARGRARADRCPRRRRTGSRSGGGRPPRRRAPRSGPRRTQGRVAWGWRRGPRPGQTRSPCVVTAIATVLVAPASTPTSTGDGPSSPSSAIIAQIIADRARGGRREAPGSGESAVSAT